MSQKSVETNGEQQDLFPSWMEYLRVQKQIESDTINHCLLPGEMRMAWEMGLNVIVKRKRNVESEG